MVERAIDRQAGTGPAGGKATTVIEQLTGQFGNILGIGGGGGGRGGGGGGGIGPSGGGGGGGGSSGDLAGEALRRFPSLRAAVTVGPATTYTTFNSRNGGIKALLTWRALFARS